MTDTTEPTISATAHGPGEGEALWHFGGLATIKSTSATTGGRVMVSEQLAPRGVGSPLHVHHREDEWFYVLDGEVTFWVDGKVPPPPTEAPDVEALAQIAASFGIEILGPPGIPSS